MWYNVATCLLSGPLSDFTRATSGKCHAQCFGTEWIRWKIERSHAEPGAIAYRQLYCKQHHSRGETGGTSHPCLL
jgi:hypothetical protein